MTISSFFTSLHIRRTEIKIKTLVIGKYLGICELDPIQIKATPKATTIIPAANSGLNDIAYSVVDFDILA